MSAVGFRRMVERLGETPKMAFPSHPHLLRHSTVSWFLPTASMAMERDQAY
jgi:hypothetical protein